MPQIDIIEDLNRKLRGSVEPLLEVSERDYSDAESETLPQEYNEVLTPWKWHLGHLLLFIKWLLQDLHEGLDGQFRGYQGSFPELEELFVSGTEFRPRADYPPLAELTGEFRRVLEAIDALLDEYDREQLFERYEVLQFKFEYGGETHTMDRSESPHAALVYTIGHVWEHYGQMRLVAKAQQKWSWKQEVAESCG